MKLKEGLKRKEI